jgi:esterase/lipase superfamily enzyme/predicted  nucleic acid-binding Zn-ribbon protein
LSLVVLGGCTTRSPPPPGPGGQASAATTTEEVRRLEGRIGELEKTREELDEGLAASRERERELRATIDALQAELAMLRAAQAEAPARVEALSEELEASRERLERQRAATAAARDELAGSRAELDATRDELRDVRAGYEARLRALNEALTVPAAEPTGGDIVVDVAPQAEPTVVALFYGTNRARLERRLHDYVIPFLAPAVLLLLTLITPKAARRYLKERYQKRTIVTWCAIFGAATVALTILAMRETVQTRDADSRLAVQYGNLRLQHRIDGAPYELGICEVTIPPNHVAGEVELPELTAFEFVADPTKHFVLRRIDPATDSETFYAQLRSRVAQSDDDDLFVFVHGFHNTFEDAAFRTAQIVHDLDFHGAPVFFSWPSQGRLFDYQTDENNVGEAVDDLRHFLQALNDWSGAKRIHLIAHSMGSRALANALMRLDARYRTDNVFNETVFAAPDIDAETLGQIATEMTQIVERVTVYASSRDFALRLSRFLHGDDYQRAGETSPRPLVALPVETIDVSRVSSGHAYIADTGRVLTDLLDIMKDNRPLTDDVAIRIPVDDDSHYWLMQ